MLTIIIPAFNAEHFVGDAIASAIAVAERVIVVNDGSSDRTSFIAKKAGAIVIDQANSGASVARQRGAQAAATDFILFLDADDRVIGEGVVEGLHILRTLPNTIALIGGYIVNVESGSQVLPWREGVSTVSLLRRAHSPAPPASILWRRESYNNIDLDVPPISVSLAEDYQDLIRASMVGSFATMAKPMSVYTAAGGKSALDPIGDQVAAESIRRHYARATGISIHKRPNRELIAYGHLRSAMAQRAGDPRRTIYVGRSMLAYPPLYLRLIGRRIFRLSKAVTIREGV